MDVQEMLAREAIRYTMSVYNNAGDRGDLDGFISVFTPEGTLEVFGEQHNGHDAIRRFADSTASSHKTPEARQEKSYVRHHTTTSRIELTGSGTALAWTYFQIFSNGEDTRTGMYVDKFVKDRDRWLIDHRRVKLDGE